MTKKLILLLTIASLGAQHVQAMSFKQKLMANQNNTQTSHTDRRAIIATKKKWYSWQRALSLATLSAYGIKAAVTRYQGKPLRPSNLHQGIIAAAAIAAPFAHWQLLRLDQDLPRLESSNDLSSPAAIIATGKKLIIELQSVTQAAIPANQITPNNGFFAYCGKKLTTDMRAFAAAYYGNRELNSQAQITELLTQEHIVLTAIPEHLQIIVTMQHILKTINRKEGFVSNNAHFIMNFLNAPRASQGTHDLEDTVLDDGNHMRIEVHQPVEELRAKIASQSQASFRQPFRDRKNYFDPKHNPLLKR